jgi:hypothetical protein
LFKDIFTPHFTQSVNYYPDIPSFSELINREDEVESISKSITNRDQKPPSFITICGMPEIGKTALAAHLFHLHRTNSVWVSPGLDLERCEDYLNRISRAVFMGQEQPIIAVNHELHLKDFWLFLDGVDAFIEDDKFRGFLSRLSPRDKGKVVATSVSQIGLPSEYWLELSGLSLDDAVALFDNRWQRKNRNLSDAQLADVRTICGKNLLSGHPASIERIAANLGSKKRADLSTVVTRLRRDIQQASDKEGKAILTVDISLQSRTEQATNLLARLSLLPGKFDDGVVRILSEISPSLSWQDAIDELIIARLIQVNHRIDETSVYLVPSVVKAVARQKVRELPELKDLQKCVGNLLVQSSKDSEWAYGLCNLYKGEKWAGVLSAFKERYNASFFGEHLFVESNLTLINRASACYAIAYSFDQTGNANYARDYAEKGRDLLDSITSDSSLVYKALFLRLHTVYARNLLLLGEFPAGQRVIEFLMRFVESLDQNQSEDLQWECGQVYLLEGIYFHYLKGNDE